MFGKKDQDESAQQPGQGSAALQAEVARLEALPLAEVAVEVMTKGFGSGGRGADDEQITVSGQNVDSGPDVSGIADRFVPEINRWRGRGPGDEALWNQLDRLVAEGVQQLELAALVRAQLHSASGSLDFAATRLGRSALESGTVERILGRGTA